MLFSQPDVARFLSQEFECAWQSVRPVPHVTIDFGDGRTLERTLHGNIVTYLCTSAGEVFDLVPGLVDAQEYVRRLEQALRLKRALGGTLAALPLELETLSPGRSAEPAPSSSADTWRSTVTLWHETLVARSRAGEVVAEDPIAVFDLSKMRVERRLDETVLPRVSLGDTEALRRDTQYNRAHRYPLASALLLERPFARPTEITADVYRHVLGVELEDPYLGLAPDVLGGAGGRH